MYKKYELLMTRGAGGGATLTLVIQLLRKVNNFFVCLPLNGLLYYSDSMDIASSYSRATVNVFLMLT